MTTATIKASINETILAGRRINRLQNEGGEGYDHTDHAKLRKLAANLIDVEWTREATMARRAEWNAAVRASNAKTARDAMRLSARLGYGPADLKDAIRRHGL